MSPTHNSARRWDKDRAWLKAGGGTYATLAAEVSNGLSGIIETAPTEFSILGIIGARSMPQKNATLKHKA